MRLELPELPSVLAKRRARIPEWMAAASGGNVAAQVALGWEYARGDVVELDLTTALGWFDRAAASGDEEALVNRARFLQLRHVPDGNRQLRKFAASGNWKAQFFLAQTFQFQHGRRNQLKAIAWFKRSASNGNLLAGLMKYVQLTRVARWPAKISFIAGTVVSIGRLIFQLSRREVLLEKYEPLMFKLKSRQN